MAKARESGTITLSVNFELGKKGLDDLSDRLKSAASAAMRAVAEALLADSRAFVPVLSGKLLDSGRIEEIPNLDTGIVYYRIVYGNDVVEYARTQHDDPYNHPSLGFFGRARYLAKPMELNGRYYTELATLVMRQHMGAAVE